MTTGAALWRPFQLVRRLPRLAFVRLQTAQFHSSVGPRSQSLCKTTVRCSAPSATRGQLHTRRLLSTVASSVGSADEVDELKRWVAAFDRDAIPYHSFTVHHARSSGAGGQNVNKGQSHAASVRMERSGAVTSASQPNTISFITPTPASLLCWCTCCRSQHEGRYALRVGQCWLAPSATEASTASDGERTDQLTRRAHHHISHSSSAHKPSSTATGTATVARN